MKLQLQITARNVELSDWTRAEITRRAEKLDSFYNQIMRCRVVVEVPHRHHHEGVLHNISIELRVPGAELVIKREPHEDLEVAIRDAFDAARRQVEDFAGRHRGDVKRHEGAAHGLITALFPDKGYGFLTTPEGRDIYFHEHSVLNHDFKHLKLGTEVRFAEEQGQKGPQASTVTVVGG